ncbi:hypothetical protein NX059_000807 [Plenodomus lindquistii]|nr:hypothetical protein NX059_000807 [Plenodomus lindquistii]
MLQMDLPHLNVLTKIDNLRNYPNLPFNLDFYTEVHDLHYLLPYLNREQTSGIPGPTSASADVDEDMDDDEPTSKFSALNKAIVELVEDYSLVGFETLAVEDKKSMMTLLQAIDRAGGFAMGGIEGVNNTVWQMAMQESGATMDARDVQERWLDRREELDEEERKAWEEETKDLRGPPPPEPRKWPEDMPRKSQPPDKPKDKDGDDDMDDLEEMRRFMEEKKHKDDGIKIKRKLPYSLESMNLKRKLSTDWAHPHEDDPTLERHRNRKRLFQTKHKQSRTSTPTKLRVMSDLLEYILKNEEAFQNRHRLPSLYADFGQQLDINPEGYHANVAVWIKALTDASQAGLIPTQGSTHDLLNIRNTDELARALQHPHHGTPTCLTAVFNEATQKKEMIPRKDFVNSKESIYKTSWVPTPWQVMRWGLRQVGVLGQPQPHQQATGDFVVVKNVEIAANEVLKKMTELNSTADRVLSKADFLKRFSKVLNPDVPLTTSDLDILLVFLARDKQAISYNAHTIKFKAEHEVVPPPVTTDDDAIANLRDTLSNINAQLLLLMERIAAADAAAREAVANKQMIRAKAALRSKKLAEATLAQRTEIAHQLETVYDDLQHAADQVEIVEAMRAGAAALKGLNEKVGGAEGVQGVVDAVNEQMAHTEEITNIINENGQPLDETEIDDEFEALERAEKAKEDQHHAEKTQARLADIRELEQRLEKQKAEEKRLEEAEAQAEAEERQRVEHETEIRHRKHMAERARVRAEKRAEEQTVDQASADLSKLSFIQESGDETEDEQRVPMYA